MCPQKKASSSRRKTFPIFPVKKLTVLGGVKKKKEIQIRLAPAPPFPSYECRGSFLYLQLFCKTNKNKTKNKKYSIFPKNGTPQRKNGSQEKQKNEKRRKTNVVLGRRQNFGFVNPTPAVQENPMERSGEPAQTPIEGEVFFFFFFWVGFSHPVSVRSFLGGALSVWVGGVGGCVCHMHYSAKGKKKFLVGLRGRALLWTLSLFSKKKNEFFFFIPSSVSFRVQNISLLIRPSSLFLETVRRQ